MRRIVHYYPDAMGDSGVTFALWSWARAQAASGAEVSVLHAPGVYRPPQKRVRAATVMHDLGLGEHAQGQARFEVEGADLAAGVLRKQGVAEADVDKVWEAIALHACIGIADRRGLLTYLTHRGVFMDIGRTEDPVASQLRQEVFNAYPRPAGDRSIADAIVKHAARSEAAAPRGSLAAELLREHREAGGAV